MIRELVQCDMLMALECPVQLIAILRKLFIMSIMGIEASAIATSWKVWYGGVYSCSIQQSHNNINKAQVGIKLTILGLGAMKLHATQKEKNCCSIIIM